MPANPPSFEVVRVPKPAPVQWRARTVRLADMDGDDDLDLIGMLTTSTASYRATGRRSSSS